MTGQPPPSELQQLLVERRTYRRRRLVDAARALPLLGLLLWSVPLLWSLSATPMRASGSLIFLFSVWVWLVFVAGALIFALGRPGRLPTSEGDPE